MKSRLFFIICISLFCVSCSTTSQVKSITTGNVMDYLEQTPQAADHPDAGASLLHSYAYVEFFKDGTSVTRHVERYKIFNERGRKHATKTITYREGYQKASILFANTIKANGQIVPLAKQDVFDGTQYAGYDFYTDIKFKRFTMPAVENGCIVEYAHEIVNMKPSFRFDYSTIFLCRNLYPMQEDILEIVLPADKTLNFRIYNTRLAPRIITDGDKKRYIFTNLKQEAIVPEPRMPPLWDRDSFPQAWIWTMKDWKAISTWYIRLVTEQMTSNQELESFTRQLISGKKNQEEKISAIFKFVSQNIRYIAVLLGPHTHKPHAASDVFQKRYGDCKDKTVLLLTMLKIAGIEAYPVLVPAQREYFDESMPSLNAFNHVIAAVPSGDSFFWLDATNETASFNSPPFIRPSKVFLIHADGTYRFLETPALDDQRDYSKSMASLHIDSEGNADISYHYTYFGKAAEAVRYIYKYLPPDQRKKIFEKRGVEVTDLSFGSFIETESPFFVSLNGKLKNLAQVIDQNTMILSNVTRLDSYRDITAASHRLYPVLLRPSFHTQQTFRYIFPAGFSVKSVPENFVSKQPHQDRIEKFSMQASVFEVHIETSNRGYKIIPSKIEDFKKHALELQKHETKIKNIILERKQ